MEIVAFSKAMQQSAADFFTACFSAIGIPYSPTDRHADIADIENNYMHNGCFWCLLDNGILVGTAALRIIDAENNIAELKRMFVHPDHQGKGHGKQLLDHAITYARAQGFNKIVLDTRRQFTAAQHLYKSRGFKETEKYNDNSRAELFFELVL